MPVYHSSEIDATIQLPRLLYSVLPLGVSVELQYPFSKWDSFTSGIPVMAIERSVWNGPAAIAKLSERLKCPPGNQWSFLNERKSSCLSVQYRVQYIQLPLTPFSSTDKHRQTLSSTMEVILSRPLYHVQFITKNHSNNCLIIRTTLCYRQLSWPQNYQIPTISSSIVRISLLRSGQMFRSMSGFHNKDI